MPQPVAGRKKNMARRGDGIGAALEAFILEHECCGELDAAVEDDRVWVTETEVLPPAI